MTVPVDIHATVRHQLHSSRGIPSPPWWADRTGLRADAVPPGEPIPIDGVSVVVPAWNSQDSLAACVASIGRAAAALGQPVEVIIVDDGSDTDAYQALAVEPPSGTATVVRVVRGGQSAASNTGAQLASGEVLVFIDSDMVLNPWSLLALTTVLARSPEALCFGFREDADPCDPRLEPEFLSHGPGLDSDLLFADDNRFLFDLPGFPNHLFSATNHLRDLSGFRRVRPPGRTAWTLPRMAYGCILACWRERFLELGGFDTRFVHWGYNDTEFSSRWIARGWQLAPVVRANGLHVSHRARHPLQWRRAGQSARRYERSLDLGWHRGPVTGLPVVAVRHLRGADGASPPAAARLGPDPARRAAIAGDLARFEHAVGRVVDAAAADPALAGWALRVLRLSGDARYLEFDAGTQVAGAVGFLERALLRAAQGDLVASRADLMVAGRLAGWRWAATARYLLHRPASAHRRLARAHLRSGLPRVAAGALLAWALATPGGRIPTSVVAALAEIPPADRRFY